MATTYWFTPEQLKKVIDRIEPQANGCWWYPAAVGDKGYATTRIGWPITKGAKIHRLSWIYYKGDIPNGMVLDHLCHDPAICKVDTKCEHRRCVNPDHLQLVPKSENSKKTSRLYKYRTHCKNGHSLKENMVATTDSKQWCRLCDKASKKRSSEKKKAEAK